MDMYFFKSATCLSVVCLSPVEDTRAYITAVYIMKMSMINFSTKVVNLFLYIQINLLINMNTICMLKKCIQIDFSEYTLFLNTLVKFEFTISLPQ